MEFQWMHKMDLVQPVMMTDAAMIWNLTHMALSPPGPRIWDRNSTSDQPSLFLTHVEQCTAYWNYSEEM